jgi:two-component system, sensor histidine kinase and response regulator
MKTTIRLFKTFLTNIQSLGATPVMDDYERRKLSVFNVLNVMGLMNGIIIPVVGLFNNDQLPPVAWAVACSPAVISSIVLLANCYGRYELAKLIYFIFYPVPAWFIQLIWTSVSNCSSCFMPCLLYS